ncbi:hypothetical protein [Paraburkholderia phenazinium]|uniref:Uncharacterized protein n=1 Tax=Paraburkholderia phenazinium TaxID=60549 RepID=A0A1G7TRK1_9BURK|nr:hypothetical protein [Paraburkholderia phenazinium]SDG37279.1 hypothetical protein SAMN05216466_103111 [Paraburkholderia phenazinium]
MNTVLERSAPSTSIVQGAYTAFVKQDQDELATLPDPPSCRDRQLHPLLSDADIRKMHKYGSV